MSAIPYDPDREEDWGYQEEGPRELPGRKRRRFLNRWSGALLAILACGAGFYAGVRVEKGQLASSASSTGSASLSSLAAAARSSTGATPTGAGAARAGSARGFPGGGGAFLGAGFGAGNTSIGTISSVKGKTAYITEASGNVIKVTLTSATKVTKNLGVSKRSLHPGDSVVIQGAKSANGTVSATSVSDSGASNTGTGTNSSGSGSGSSAVNSLFGSGNGG
jgi:hypothetical protein